MVEQALPHHTYIPSSMQATTKKSDNLTEENRWLLAAQRGDKEAFGRIVTKYHRLVLSVTYRLCSDAELADDVAQDTFLRAWQRLPDFSPKRDSSLRAWLCRIAHNRTIDLLRQTKPQSTLEAYDEANEPGPLQQVVAEESISEVQAAIQRLPESTRSALILREYEGLSYAEIATVLDIPVGTVMSRLYHARRRLAKELAPILNI
jgi:RNA polymerase sigma-70 factor (ECF subfamily)